MMGFGDGRSSSPNPPDPSFAGGAPHAGSEFEVDSVLRLVDPQRCETIRGAQTTVKVGINILNFGPGANPATLLRWARFAEETGYHGAMISDHVAITPQVQAEFPAPFYDPFLALSWIAGQTREIELGTTVIILPYRHPLHTARLAANLDRLCGGRLILGVGVGWARDEFEALGVPFHQRGALSDEYLAVIRLCWTTPVASFQGRHIKFEHVQTGPPPLQRPGPPLWVGGSSTAALRRAVRFGDAWHPYRVRLRWLQRQALPQLRQIAEAEGKPVPAVCPRIQLRITDSPLPEDERLAGQGTLNQIRADLAALEALGTPYLLLDTYHGDPRQTLNPARDWEDLDLIAREVLDLENQTLR